MFSLHSAWKCGNEEALTGASCSFMITKGGVFGSVDSDKVLFNSKDGGPSPFSACSFPITNGVTKKSCEAKSERNKYSIVMLFTASFWWRLVDLSKAPSKLAQRWARLSWYSIHPSLGLTNSISPMFVLLSTYDVCRKFILNTRVVLYPVTIWHNLHH